MGFQEGPGRLRRVITALVLGSTLCMALYWEFIGHTSADLKPCPPCACDCLQPGDESLKESLGDLKDVILPNCGRDHPGMQSELKKSRFQLMKEEFLLNKIVRQETQLRYEKPIRDAQKKAADHEKEYESCNQKLIESEGAREMAAIDLSNQRKVTLLWEERARTLGWKDVKERGTNPQAASPSSSDQMS
ncbi:hypothetical protein MPTK1_4g12790 [Marchantia polymorpha subsp. ruderalis]|uniref:Uncharacterized protein n=2 Tax=Marchantia polymorpha TaxID=3197 RepID=A0AAF6B9A6_MARPO|nr:hypothetical protein MARPO_0138s0016 [Marchantia polymorpha]BBN08590.1 hypothetical protein Mp_4g12790 [Marchantia polymorpha subsp. ruderalis]|eukprot:PTQ29576.1 hypothetical protein MARPO_0138s0016 [Marchantia polymorpha]